MEEQNTSADTTTNPAPTPTPAPQNSSKLTIILALLLTALIVGFLTYYFTQKHYSNSSDQQQETKDESTQNGDQSQNEEQDNSEEQSQNDEVSQATADLFIAKLERTVGMNANPNSIQLHITSHNFPSGTEKEIANLTSNYLGYDDIFIDGKKIYYLTFSLQPAVYDLDTGKSEIISIPGVDNSNDGYARDYTLADFAFDQGKIVYMKGQCTEVLKCTVGVYDLATKKNQVIIEDIMKAIQPVLMDATRIEKFDADSGIIVITDNGGDAGVGQDKNLPLRQATSRRTPVRDRVRPCTRSAN